MNNIHFLFMLMLLPALGFAESTVQNSSMDLDKFELVKVKKQIRKMLPVGIEINAVAKTPISGLYQVSTPGRISYMSADGRYLLTGDLIDQQQGVNLTDSLMGEVRQGRLDDLGDDQMLVYKAKGKEKSSITVFTDTSCGYCRKLHRDIPELNKSGITVKYLLYPRSGPNTQSAQIMESVWCASDPLQSMTDAKSNKSVPSKKCDNPILEHLRIGQEFGLRGTPMIVTQTGDLIGGYLPPADLKQRIGAN